MLQGNLSEFVKVKPEARTYYDLEASGIKFVLPEPGVHASRLHLVLQGIVDALIQAYSAVVNPVLAVFRLP